MLKKIKDFSHAFLTSGFLSLYLVLGFMIYPYLFNTEVKAYTVYKSGLLAFMEFSFKLDQLSAFFALTIILISSLIAIYLIKYAQEYSSKYSLLKLSLLTHLFSLSMIGLVCADHVFTFLFFWELMSLSSYLLVIFEHRKKENINAGFVYFLMTHIATAFLLVAFLLLAGNNTDLCFDTLSNLTLTPQLKAICFFMFLIGSGIKSGMVPFHFWLPIAHPAAPSHVSALMSALMVKTPIYLMIKVVFDFLGPEIYMGYSLLLFGLISALIGIIYAVKENDLKKLLAYSTIENVGIILTGLALSIIFYIYNNEFLASLALIACLFHILNHAIYKSALFMGAGAILSATHEKDLDKLGGLIKLMPKTAIFFLIPVISIAALPFSNGFVSEWLLYQSLIKGMQLDSSSLIFILPLTFTLIAIVAGLAFITFSKLFATAFLAYPRSEQASDANEVSAVMWTPIALLSSLCLYLGINPQILSGAWIHILHQLDMPFPNGMSLYLAESSFPSKTVIIIVATFCVILLILGSALGTKYRKAIPWTCGYDVNERAQYNSSSFSQPSLRLMNNFYKIDFAKIFTTAYFYFSHSCQNIRDSIQSGNLHSYLLYILITLIGGLIYAKYF